MKDSDIQSLALKHKLPMVPQSAQSHPWAYTDQVMAFGRELAGDTQEGRVFPPLPLSVFDHPKLGEMWMRFDLHAYAERYARNVQDELDALKATSRAVLANGTQHDVGGGDVFIGTCDSTEALQRALDAAPVIPPDDSNFESWWVKALNAFWGDGSYDLDTRRAAKVACNMAAQFAEKGELNGDVLDLLADVLDAKEVMREAGCKQAPFGEMFSEFIGKRAAVPAAADAFEQFVKDEYGMTAQQAGRASFGIGGLRLAFEMGQQSKAGQWVHCSPALLNAGVSCADTPRRACECIPANGGHDHFIAQPKEQA